jgi:hypothetical protein
MCVVFQHHTNLHLSVTCLFSERYYWHLVHIYFILYCLNDFAKSEINVPIGFSRNALPSNKACLLHTNDANIVSIRQLLSSGITLFSNLLSNFHWVHYLFCTKTMLCYPLLQFTCPTTRIISPRMPKTSIM